MESSLVVVSKATSISSVVYGVLVISCVSSACGSSVVAIVALLVPFTEAFFGLSFVLPHPNNDTVSSNAINNVVNLFILSPPNIINIYFFIYNKLPSHIKCFSKVNFDCSI